MLLKAFETICPPCSTQEIKLLTEYVPYVFPCDQADACPTNRRAQLEVGDVLKEHRNVLQFRTRCVARASVGDLHACAVAFGHPQHAQAIQSSLMKLLKDEPPHIIPGRPPAELVRRNRHIIQISAGAPSR